MENMQIYTQCAEVPKEAQRAIQAGRLKGKTDINPMWRIKKLTEMFGACGVGWIAPVVAHWIDDGVNGEKIVNVKIALQVKIDGEWSKPIDGIGGNLLIQKETAGLHTNDEAYKMAYTDAISVACKMLGMGASVYWQQDKTKYTGGANAPENAENDAEAKNDTAKTKKAEIRANTPPQDDLPFPMEDDELPKGDLREQEIKNIIKDDGKYKAFIASIDKVWGIWDYGDLTDGEYKQLKARAMTIARGI